jgi:hypothetical protein
MRHKQRRLFMAVDANGHWVSWATATAMIYFVLAGSAPSAKTFRLNV